MKPKALIWVVVAVAVVAMIVVSFRPAAAGVTDVGPDQMADLLSDGVFVVDVRTAGEFEAAHLPGAVNVPVNQLATTAASWDPSTPIAVYCATGSRSVGAVNTLADLGFTEIYHYAAGIVTWAGAVESGTSVAAAPVTAEPSASGLPVMYEFFTDW